MWPGFGIVVECKTVDPEEKGQRVTSCRSLRSAFLAASAPHSLSSSTTMSNHGKHRSEWFDALRQKRPTPGGRLTFVGLRGAECVHMPLLRSCAR
jgi:hypothetical protein